jgi:hypothetical protein
VCLDVRLQVYDRMSSREMTIVDQVCMVHISRQNHNPNSASTNGIDSIRTLLVSISSSWEIWRLEYVWQLPTISTYQVSTSIINWIATMAIIQLRFVRWSSKYVLCRSNPGPHVHTSSETVPQDHWWDRELLKWILVLLEKVCQKSVGQDLWLYDLTTDIDHFW